MTSAQSDLESIIRTGNEIMVHKYFCVAVSTVFFYDYFLTLADEVKYSWPQKGSWTFWLLAANKYFPMTWQFWLYAVSYTPRSQTTIKICERSSFYGLFAFVVCTHLAQVVITLRVYAVTMKNLPITLWFAVITVAQCVLGIWIVVLTAKKGAVPQPPIPLDAYNMCIFVQTSQSLEFGYIGISLLYDTLAFSLIVFVARKKKATGFKFKSLFDTIAENAMWYFLVIFALHLLLMLTLNFGRGMIQLLPGPGIMVFLPIMISRIMISLRKAVDLTQKGLGDTGQTSACLASQRMKFAYPKKLRTRWEDTAMPLDTFIKA